jgi:hypothetical protein
MNLSGMLNYKKKEPIKDIGGMKVEAMPKASIETTNLAIQTP